MPSPKMHAFLSRAVALTAPLAMALMLLSPAHGALPAAVGDTPVPSLAPMLERVTPAVVNISSKTHVKVRDPFFDDPFFRRFFGVPDAPRERVEQSLGSGVIVDADKGYVLTNNHVIAGADDITVTIKDGRSFKAKVVGADPDTDVAVLRIPAKNLTALKPADSSKLRVGDFVVAVGDPFGLGQTVTSGIVSALQRTGLGDTYQNFIQTDASINPGNSGGALVNLKGQLVGINTMIYSPSGGNVGIGFAIPVNLADSVREQLVTHGSVKRGNLGVETQDITPQLAQALGLDDTAAGAVVTRVDPDAPAAQAGLKPGDVIVALNDKPVTDRRHLLNAEGLTPVGSQVQLKVLRNGQAQTISARLAPEKLAHGDGGSIDPRLRGLTFSDLGHDLREKGLYGVQVTKIDADSAAARRGMQEGDVLVAVNQHRIANLDALRTLLAAAPQQLLLTLVRGRRVFYLILK